MSSTQVFPRSVFSSKRNSIQRDDHGESSDVPRRLSNRSPAGKMIDDKISLADNTPPQAFQMGIEADPVKFPLLQQQSTLDFGALVDASFKEFGKSFIDDDRLRGFGIGSQQPSTDQQRSRGHSRAGATDKLPIVVMGGPQQDPEENVYELDVSFSNTDTFPAPGHISTQKQSQAAEDASSSGWGRAKTNLTSSHDQTPKNSDPPIKELSEPLASTKPKRPLSGFSIKSMKAALTRASDAPEVVQSQDVALRGQSLDHGPKTAHPVMQGRDEASYFATSAAQDSIGGYQLPFAPRHPRAMASTPSLQQKFSSTVEPAKPQEAPKPWMSRRPSATSLRSTMSNINKPLPPEPGQQTPSVAAQVPRARAKAPTKTPTTVSNKSPWQRSPTSPAATRFLSSSRRYNTAPPSQHAQLRSRYTPKDLDALDDAFQRGASATPLSNGTYKTSFVVAQAPSPVQASPYGDRLDPIKESPHTSQANFDPNAPLQISRGPMKMEPMRRPPPTPSNRSRSPANRIPVQEPIASTPSGQVSKGSQGKRSVAITPMHPLGSRPSSPNAHRGPGQPKAPHPSNDGNTPEDQLKTSTSMDRRPSASQHTVSEKYEIDRSGSEAQPSNNPHSTTVNVPSSSAWQAPVQPSMPLETNNDGGLNYSDPGPYRDGRSDAQFDEIRRRLELLSPATATDTSFVTSQIFGQMLSNQYQPIEIGHRVDTGVPEQPKWAEQDVSNEPVATRPASIAPVELPAEVNWSASLQGLYEMAGYMSPRVSVQPATPAALAGLSPPPIPLSPKRQSRRNNSNTQSMLSSGSGRTKSIRSVKSARSERSRKARSLTSVAASEIPELYAGLPSPRITLASRRQSAAAEDSDVPDVPELPPMPEIATTEELEEIDVISADTAEQVLYQILRNLHEPEDLFNASLISQGFERTFRTHDTKLLRNALWYTSPAAWEYLEMHMPISAETGQIEYPANIYRQQYLHDMRCMRKLKEMILQHCRRSLSPLTVLMLEAKSTKHSAPVDDAIWRIWTFCKIFGEDEDRKEDVQLQKRWIKGKTIIEAQAESSENTYLNVKDFPAFGIGNDEGLTPEELMRMGEIWLCLRVLVRGYRGQRTEAREFGIFEGAEIARDDIGRENAILDEWTIHLLSLAPGTNLDVLCPTTATQDNFITAESLGFTSWTPPGRNFISSGFLTGPVSSVLEEWLDEESQSSTGSARDDSIHPAFRNNQHFPSRQQIGLIVDKLRTAKDVLTAAPPPDKKPAQGQLSPPNKAAVGQSPAATPKANKVTLASTSDNSKPSKESKKTTFSAFGSKISLRLPSRSQTTASRSKAEGARVEAPSRNDSVESKNGITPGPTTISSRIDLFRAKTQRGQRRMGTTSGGGQGDADHVRDRPSDLFADATIAVQRELPSQHHPGASADGPVSAAEKLPLSETVGTAPDSWAVTPRALAHNRLVALGHDSADVDDVLDEVAKDGKLDFDKALKKLRKLKQLEERLRRLDRMG